MPPNPFSSWFNRAAPSPEDEQKQERSWAELQAGRLPLSAQERLATQAGQGVFTSALSARDLTAVGAAGYQPLGQAFGTATYRLNRLTYAGYQIHPNPYLGSSRYATLRINPVMIGSYHEGERRARTQALARMTAECEALGGDGVLGVQIQRSWPAHGVFEFTLIGTVVRLGGRTRDGSGSATPFITTMSAAQVGRLDASGWRPVSLLFELQRFAGHAGYVGFGAGRLNPTNYQTGEVASATTVLEYARARTRQLLNARLPRQGGMILDTFTAELEQQECTAIEGQSDFVVDVEAIGTSIESVPSHRRRPAGSARTGLQITPVLPLNDRGDL